MKYLFICFLFFGCSEPVKPRILTDIQIKYLEALTLTEKVYMEECLKRNPQYIKITDCQANMAKDLYPSQQPRNADGSIIKTAVGTAIGYGAAKMILGK